MGFWDTDSDGLDWYDLTAFGMWDNAKDAWAAKDKPADNALTPVDATTPVVTGTESPAKPPNILDRVQTAINSVTGFGGEVTGNYAVITRNVAIIAAVLGTIYLVAVFAPAVRPTK